MAACDLCGDPAVGRFALSHGCVVRPDLREMDLCVHHARRATPKGSFEPVADYTLPGGLRLPDLLAGAPFRPPPPGNHPTT